jgi:hypothetical protein
MTPPADAEDEWGEVLDVDADRLAEDVAYRRALVAFSQNQYIATHSGNPAYRTLFYAGAIHKKSDAA